MGPKTRKSVTPWFSCEGCHAIVTSKDLSVHQEKSCPPSSKSWVHGYIKDKVVYSFVEELKSQDSVKHIPKDELDNIVLLSQSALQICDICIGDPVLVKIGESQAIYKAWPTSQKSLISVILPQDSLSHISSTGTGYSSAVSVQKLNATSLPAQEIALYAKHDVEIPSDISNLLCCRYVGRLLCVGNVMTIQHYGRSIELVIEHIIPLQKLATNDPVENVTQALSDLDIVMAKQGVFKIFDSTQWKVKIKTKTEIATRNECILSDIGGLDDIVCEMRELMDLALGVVQPVEGLKTTRGILLYGVSGVGKTLLARTLALSSKVNMITISGPEIYSKYFGETEKRLKDSFNLAKQRSPTIILLDDIDSLCPGRSGRSDQEKRVVATLLTQLDGLHITADKSILVLATSRQPETIDKALRRPGRLDREVEIPVPSSKARQEILMKMLAKMDHRLLETEIQQIASAAHGFVGADLASLCSQAGALALRRNDDHLIMTDFKNALNIVKPSAMREVLLEVPCVRWSDIGGQQNLKLQLAQAVEWPLKHPEAFARLGIPPPRGVLMFGPPGCSKTMIAKALATESKLNFLSIKGPELFSKWVGESERAVRAVFRRARQVAPAIVFFDELDALAGHRATGGGNEGGSNVQERVLAQLLTELDGVEPLGNVVIVAATNRPDRIDKALLRPGRLDRVVYVPLPDDATRSEIFSIQLKKTPVASDVDISELVSKTEGYSGAEVLAVCHEAALKALEEDLKAAVVNRSHFLKALTLVTPRTPPELLQLYQDYLHQ